MEWRPDHWLSQGVRRDPASCETTMTLKVPLRSPRPPGPTRQFRLIAVFALASLVLAACGGSSAPVATPTFTLQEARGKEVFSSFCSRCHESGVDSVIVGPSLAGIATRASERVPGMDARTYITESIMEPSAYVVEGFPDGLMPHDLVEELGEEDVGAVVAYLLTLDH